MMRKYLLIITIFTITFFAFSTLNAAIKVVKIKGKVAFKSGKKWKSLSKGMNLNEGVKISTGVRSSVVLNMNGNILTIKPLSMVKIYKNSFNKKFSRTRIGLRRGGLRAKINKRRKIRTSFKVSTPVATSSVRGTIEDIFYGPNKGMIIKVIEGIIQGDTPNGFSKKISGRQIFQQKKGKIMINPILFDVKKNSIVNIAESLGLTSEEIALLELYQDELFDNFSTMIDRQLLMELQSRVNVNVVWPAK